MIAPVASAPALTNTARLSNPVIIARSHHAPMSPRSVAPRHRRCVRKRYRDAGSHYHAAGLPYFAFSAAYRCRGSGAQRAHLRLRRIPIIRGGFLRSLSAPFNAFLNRLKSKRINGAGAPSLLPGSRRRQSAARKCRSAGLTSHASSKPRPHIQGVEGTLAGH